MSIIPHCWKSHVVAHYENFWCYFFLFQFFPRDHEMFKRLEYPKLEYFPTVLGQGTKSMTPSFETGK